MSIWPDWWNGDNKDFRAVFVETYGAVDFACNLCREPLTVGQHFYGYRDTDDLYVAHTECVASLRPCLICQGRGYVRTTPMTAAELLTGFGRMSTLLGDNRNVGKCLPCEGKGLVKREPG